MIWIVKATIRSDSRAESKVAYEFASVCKLMLHTKQTRGFKIDPIGRNKCATCVWQLITISIVIFVVGFVRDKVLACVINKSALFLSPETGSPGRISGVAVFGRFYFNSVDNKHHKKDSKKQ